MYWKQLRQKLINAREKKVTETRTTRGKPLCVVNAKYNKQNSNNRTKRKESKFVLLLWWLLLFLSWCLCVSFCYVTNCHSTEHIQYFFFHFCYAKLCFCFFCLCLVFCVFFYSSIFFFTGYIWNKYFLF